MPLQLGVLLQHPFVCVSIDEFQVAFVTIWVKLLAHLGRPKVRWGWCFTTESSFELAWVVQIAKFDRVLLAVQTNLGLDPWIDEHFRSFIGKSLSQPTWT